MVPNGRDEEVGRGAALEGGAREEVMRMHRRSATPPTRGPGIVPAGNIALSAGDFTRRRVV
jgi:hypothetical protein